MEVKSLKEVGYIANESTQKAMNYFARIGFNGKRKIPTMCIEGKSDVDKMLLTESFAKMINAKIMYSYLCMERYDIDFILKPNYDQGDVMKALKSCLKEPTVLVFHGLGKAFRGHKFLIDLISENINCDNFESDYTISNEIFFDNSSYLKYGYKLHYELLVNHVKAGNYPLWIFILPDDDVELNIILSEKCLKLSIDRTEKGIFLETLGVEDSHYMGKVYDMFPELGISLAKDYLYFINSFNLEFDEYILKEYLSRAYLYEHHKDINNEQDNFSKRFDILISEITNDLYI